MVKKTNSRTTSDLSRNICGVYILNDSILVLDFHEYICVQVNGHTRSDMTYYVG